MSDLIERLRAHAALHRGLGVDDDDEQAQWARDLLTAADEIERLTAERDDLRRQLAEAEQDARRYRHLVEKHSTEVDDYGTLGITFRCDFEHYNDIDAAIDAAMGLTRPAGES